MIIPRNMTLHGAGLFVASMLPPALGGWDSRLFGAIGGVGLTIVTLGVIFKAVDGRWL